MAPFHFGLKFVEPVPRRGWQESRLTDTPITHVRISIQETQRIVEQKLLPALEGEPVDFTLMALFALAGLLMKPDISPEDLAEAIRDMSQHYSLVLMDVEEMGTPQ